MFSLRSYSRLDKCVVLQQSENPLPPYYNKMLVSIDKSSRNAPNTFRTFRFFHEWKQKSTGMKHSFLQKSTVTSSLMEKIIYSMYTQMSVEKKTPYSDSSLSLMKEMRMRCRLKNGKSGHGECWFVFKIAVACNPHKPWTMKRSNEWEWKEWCFISIRKD